MRILPNPGDGGVLSKAVLNAITVIAATQAHLIDVFGRMLGRQLGPDDMDQDNWVITELGQLVSANRIGMPIVYGVDVVQRFVENGVR